jgi:hypothetical protein
MCELEGGRIDKRKPTEVEGTSFFNRKVFEQVKA